MPQLDVYTYFNISIAFFFFFIIFYVITTYCVFSILNFVQKSRFFFDFFLAKMFDRLRVFYNSEVFVNISIFQELDQFKMFIYQSEISDRFYISVSSLFFVKLDLVYFEFVRLYGQQFIEDLF